MKVIIAGPRDYTDYENVKIHCDRILKNQVSIEIVSGRCDDSISGKHTFTTKDGTKVYGADGLGERYAEEKGYPVTGFEAQWKILGKKAGPYRNNAMGKYAEYLIAFWDEKSKGTGNMIEVAGRYGLKTRVIKYQK